LSKPAARRDQVELRKRSARTGITGYLHLPDDATYRTVAEDILKQIAGTVAEIAPKFAEAVPRPVTEPEVCGG